MTIDSTDLCFELHNSDSSVIVCPLHDSQRPDRHRILFHDPDCVNVGSFHDSQRVQASSHDANIPNRTTSSLKNVNFFYNEFGKVTNLELLPRGLFSASDPSVYPRIVPTPLNPSKADFPFQMLPMVHPDNFLRVKNAKNVWVSIDWFE